MARLRGSIVAVLSIDTSTFHSLNRGSMIYRERRAREQVAHLVTAADAARELFEDESRYVRRERLYRIGEETTSAQNRFLPRRGTVDRRSESIVKKETGLKSETAKMEPRRPATRLQIGRSNIAPRRRKPTDQMFPAKREKRIYFKRP